MQKFKGKDIELQMKINTIKEGPRKRQSGLHGNQTLE